MKIKPLRLEYVEDRKGHDFKYYSSNKKIKNSINIKISDFKKSLRKTINWYLKKV